MNHKLNDKNLQEGIAYLIRVDPDFAFIVDRFGPSPLWARDPGFATLVRIILEQQVSLASARATFNRLTTVLNPLSETHFIQLSDSELKKIGFSRQKTRYCRLLAEAILAGNLNLTVNGNHNRKELRAQLLEIKGIGPWTVDIYFLMVLRDPDIWPQNDLALARAIQNLKGLAQLPDNKQMQKMSRNWKPWRAVAARLLWHYYLNSKSVSTKKNVHSF